jgi:hypothetical protein
VRGVGLNCGLDIASCVLVEWVERQGWLICGLDIAIHVVV